jgi:electron transfer flavoprotein-quinone oxidoreductase
MAAHRLAREGLEVIVVERGQYCGAKNVSGLLYSTVLAEAIPDFSSRAPLERPVCRRGLGLLAPGSFSLISFGSERWASPPHNHTWVVYRSQFDRWLAGEVEKAGGTILEGTVVDDLLYEGEGPSTRVAGVRIRGEEEPFRAQVVILAEGAVGLVTDRARSRLGMSRGAVPQSYGIGVKEIWALPAPAIEDRFGLEPGCGAAIEWVGSPFAGLVGGGFLYTGKESLALGMIVKAESMARARISPHDLMEGFKANPEISRYLRGGELLEYSAHIIPEGGPEAVGQLSHHGVVVVGDAAGLVNASMYHEGANLAMLSGRLAAEAAIQAHLLGDFSRSCLSLYDRMLRESFVMEDLRRLRGIEKAHGAFPRLMAELPARFCRLLTDLFEQAPIAKREIRRGAFRRAVDGLPKVRTALDIWKMRRMLG